MEIERIYTLPLRSFWINKARQKRAKIVMHKIRKFVKKHTKVEKIKIDESVNKFIYKHGFKKIENSIRIKVKGNEKEVTIYLLED